MTRQHLLSELDSSVLPAITSAFDELDKLGIVYYISEGRRTLLTQCLYALQGRLGEGREAIPFASLQAACRQAGVRQPDKNIITWTLQSRHFEGKAVDLLPIRDDKVLWSYTGNEAAFSAIVAVMKKNGFKWGGDWAEKDYPHYEM